MSRGYPRFPLYVVSKGRSGYMMTSKALTKQGVRHYVVVEPQEVAEYEAAVRKMNLSAEILELDLSFKDRYELCDKLGLTKSTGPGPARNFAWEHSISNGFKWHWVMDDNIRYFLRMNKGCRIQVGTPKFWWLMEEFILRYTNVGMAGPNYSMFAFGASEIPPFITNTRIYSCNLIRNDLPFRWRGRYNEDTILSLDMLKAGWCTVQFNAFLQNKIGTQSIKGGNTTEFYDAEGKLKPGSKYTDTGTLAKSQMQVAVHPDVSKLVWKFGRWHHHVNYLPFKRNALKLDPNVKLSAEVDEHGLGLLRVSK